MMIKKKILNPDRIRRIHGGFSFIPHRFLSQGFLPSLQQKEILLYLFLVLASDRHGLSFYSYDKICTLLQMDLDQYINARNGLIDKDLIAFDGTVFQVLELPATPVVSPTPFKSRPQANKKPGAHRPPCRPIAKTDGAMKRQTTPEEVIVALKQSIEDHHAMDGLSGLCPEHPEKSYRWRLTQFINLIKAGSYGWKDIFTYATIKRFKGPPHADYQPVEISLLRRAKLLSRSVIPTPSVNLPDVFEDYLRFRKKFHQTPERTIKANRRVLSAFAQHLERHCIKAADS
jgi:hypothetical protein